VEIGELINLDGVKRELSSPRPRAGKLRVYRSIWISDLHLGTSRVQAAALLDFLLHHEAENLFLIGDIIDGWNRGAGWSWSATQDAVAAELRRWARRGTRVELIPGNHDLSSDLAEQVLGLRHGEPELIYRTAEGRRMLVIHGHQFDGSVASGRWFQGTQAYAVAMRINEWYARDFYERSERARSLSRFLRYRVKRAVQLLTEFDDREIFNAVRDRHADGIICGHTHRPEQRLIGPVWYINDGDWVESCTALVEKLDGSLQLVRWNPVVSELEVSAAGAVS
jgi:UDP-2,3-diacylglucosamine pyrophosphatase LpxH